MTEIIGVAIASRTERPGLRPATDLRMLIVFSLVVPVGLVAVALGFGLIRLPYELFLVVQRLPLLFPLHMIASGVALILIPIAAFARHRHGVHRTVGRYAVVMIAVGGLTALPVALASEASAVARGGFFVQGLVWLALLAAALAAIRRGARARHAALMIAMAAVASGAIWLRLVMAVAVAAKLPFAEIYAAAAWLCWLIPLALAAHYGATHRLA
jgi:hypothetical protein